MLNELEGAGLLGLPYAIKLCGSLSFICLGVVGAVAGFTGYLLAMCMYEPKSRRCDRYTPHPLLPCVRACVYVCVCVYVCMRVRAGQMPA